MCRMDTQIVGSLNLSADDILKRCGFQLYGPVQMAVDQSVIDYSGPYVPASPDRTLEKSAQIFTVIGSGEVVWDTWYAHYQYMGVVYGPNFLIDVKGDGVLEWRSPKDKKKHKTDRRLKYDHTQNPMAGPFWFDRMVADHKKDILNSARGAAMKEV